MKKPSARNKQYWLDLGYSELDSIKLARSRMPGTLEYYTIFKNIPEDEARVILEEWKDKRKITLKNFVEKYGLERGTNRWNDYIKKQAFSNSFEYKQERHGWTKDEYDKYNKSRAVTLENLISRYGIEEGNIRWNHYVNIQRTAGCTIEYFIRLYGEIEGTSKYQEICRKKSHSFSSYLERFNGNAELATKSYNDYRNTIRKWSRERHSIIANDLFDNLLIRLVPHQPLTIFCENTAGEWFVYDFNNKRMYFVDFYIKELKRVIEFNGDYWHANPKLYNECDMISYPNGVQKTAKEIWDYDNRKRDVILKHPGIIDVLVIWESEYKTNKEETINKCMQFLTKY